MGLRGHRAQRAAWRPFEPDPVHAGV